MSSPENGAAVPVDQLVIGRVVTMNAKREIFSAGAVAIAAGDIVAVGERDTLMQRYRAGSILGSDSSIILPGLIDAHTHCTACFARGLTTGELPMIPRLYNPGQRCHTPEEAKTAVRLVAAQLLRSGATTVCEGSLIPNQEEAMLEALEQVGIRCCFARGHVDQEFTHAALYAQVREKSSLRVVEGAAEKDLRVTEALLKRYPPRGRQRIRAAVSPSSLTGFSEGYFRGAAALAR
jgi:5-methylthioadenosine/S-adenosylhomocysteine deaminase